MTIEERLRKIEEQVGESGNIPEETRTELLSLLAALKSEISALPRDQEEDARSVATFAEASAHEAMRNAKKPQLLEAALSGLTGSVQEFETTHPDLAAVLNRLAVVLSNMGM